MKFYSNIDLLLNEIQNFRVHNLAAAPQNPVEGQHYFNTVDKTEYVFDGTKWVNALSQRNYTFKNGIVEDENRNVSLTAATADAIGGVTIGKNIDVEAGKISVKDASETDKGLIQVASDAEATAGTDTLKAINAKQLKAVADAADEAVKAEAERAGNAETALDGKITAEATRATEAETALDGKITAEAERAAAAEGTLTTNLANEVTRATQAEEALDGKIAAEAQRADAAEKANKAAIEAEVTRATEAEAALDKKIADEAKRADEAEKALDKKITDEVTRAKAAEKTNADAITALDGRLTTAEGAIEDNANAIAAETERATGAEGTLTTNLNAEIDRAKAAEKTNADNIVAEKERAQAAEKANADAIAADVADLAAFKTTVADTYVPLSQKGAANGVATLDANGLVPAAQLPSFVDDVIDLVAIAAEAPAAATVGQKYYNETDKKIYTATAENTWGDAKDPEADKIYVNIGNNMSYRWSGTTMVQIGADKLKGFNGTITGDATTTTFTLNHNLGTRNVVCEVYDATTYEKVYVNILHASTTAIQAIFSQAPAVGENFIVTIIAIG